MPELDLIIRGGTIVTATGSRRADVAIADGKICSIASEIQSSSRAEIDASRLHIFPGVIDSHVHFNEPGRTHWEGFETGSKAFAAGGGTLFFDMPLNAHPPTLDADSFQQKLAAAQKSSVVDFAFWGGLVPENIDKLEELSACGVIGFKAFMSDSGIDDFSRADEKTLRAGMKRIAPLKKLVAVHAESESLTRQLAQERICQGKTSIRDYLDSRPVRAELEAIQNAIALSAETGCALHIVHVSSGSGIDLVVEAQRHGVDVTCETCPHYLVLSEEDVEKLGATAKCAPPLRDFVQQQELWNRVIDGSVNTIGSDHSPAPPDMKTDANFFKVWGGISGVQHALPLLITEGHFKHQMELSAIAALLSFNVARRFNLPKAKEALAIGSDADLALINLDASITVNATDLLYRHRQSPYIGRRLRGQVVQTLLRGETIFKDGKIVSKPLGRLVKPNT